MLYDATALFSCDRHLLRLINASPAPTAAPFSQSLSAILVSFQQKEQSLMQITKHIHTHMICTVCDTSANPAVRQQKTHGAGESKQSRYTSGTRLDVHIDQESGLHAIRVAAGLI